MISLRLIRIDIDRQEELTESVIRPKKGEEKSLGAQKVGEIGTEESVQMGGG